MHTRKTERAELRRLLLSGVSVQMLAPRRVGKTWLMQEVAKDLTAAGWSAILVDLEGMRTEDEFLAALCQEIEKVQDIKTRVTAHLTQRLKQLLGGSWDDAPMRALGKVDPQDFADALISALNAQGGDTVILVDEIALFVMERLKRNEEETNSFLYRLRRLRQKYPKVRWLFTGSIGLDVVARRANLQGALVDLEIFPLEAFTIDEARSYVSTLIAAGSLRTAFSLDDEAFTHFAKAVGWLTPYYIKLVLDRIRPTGPPAPGFPAAATPADIDRAVEMLLSPYYRGVFATWEEHLDKNFPEEDATALQDILDVCCEEADGETESTIQARISATNANLTTRRLKDLLTALAVAGFIEIAQDRWRFTSNLMRRYWLRYHHA